MILKTRLSHNHKEKIVIELETKIQQVYDCLCMNYGDMCYRRSAKTINVATTRLFSTLKMAESEGVDACIVCNLESG